MNARARARDELRAALLAHMELTRAELLAANVGLRIGDHTSSPRENALTLWNVGRALRAAPNVTLLGSILLAAFFVGPKRIVPVVLRTGLTSWVARNVKAFVGR